MQQYFQYVYLFRQSQLIKLNIRSYPLIKKMTGEEVQCLWFMAGSTKYARN